MLNYTSFKKPIRWDHYFGGYDDQGKEVSHQAKARVAVRVCTNPNYNEAADLWQLPPNPTYLEYVIGDCGPGGGQCECCGLGKYNYLVVAEAPIILEKGDPQDS